MFVTVLFHTLSGARELAFSSILNNFKVKIRITCTPKLESI